MEIKFIANFADEKFSKQGNILEYAKKINIKAVPIIKSCCFFFNHKNYLQNKIVIIHPNLVMRHSFEKCLEFDKYYIQGL